MSSQIHSSYFRTVEEYAECSQPHTEFEVWQTSRGLFNGYSRSLDTDTSIFGSRRFGASSIHSARIDDDQLLIMIPQGGKAGVIHGYDLAPQGLAIAAPGIDVHGIWNKDSDWCYWSLSIKKLENYLSKPLINKLITHSSRFINDEKYLAFAGYLNRYLSEQISTVLLSSSMSRGTVLSFEDMLYSSLESNMRILDPKWKPPNKSNRHRIVSTAIEYQKNNLIGKTTAAELAMYCQCSLRTLEYAFQEQLSMKPKAFLQVDRLNKIRKLLLLGACESIESLCFEFNVGNPGRFSQDYFKMFGEYPLNTLKKSRGTLVQP